jgi:hypothetical protein
MAKNLTEAATMALSKVKEQTETRCKPSDRFGSGCITRRGHAAKTADGVHLAPAILTGEGEIEQKSQRMWLLALVAALVVGLGGMWLLLDSSSERRLLEQWGQPPSATSWAYPYRLPTMRSRALAGGSFMPVVANISNASVVSRENWSLEPMKELSAAPYRWFAQLESLVPVAGEGPLRQALAEGLAVDEAIQRVNGELEAGRVITQSDFFTLAADYGWSNAAVELIWSVFDIAENPAPHAIDGMVSAWLEGQWPNSIEAVRFEGVGLFVEDSGTSYRLREGAYEGVLVRSESLMPFAELSVDGWAVWSLAEVSRN